MGGGGDVTGVGERVPVYTGVFEPHHEHLLAVGREDDALWADILGGDTARVS